MNELSSAKLGTYQDRSQLFSTQLQKSTTPPHSAAGVTKMHEKTLVEVGADGVAVVTINNPPLNLLAADGISYPD